MALPAGYGVLVTRPAHQAAGLCRTLEAAGARVWALPTLEIVPQPESALPAAAVAALGEADWLIFVSPNAVHHGLACMARHGVRPRPDARIAAVGKGTERALHRVGLSVTAVPQAGFTSEDLAREPAFGDMRGQRVMIVRGDSGRAWLAEHLRGQGAEVAFLAVYRAVRPQVDAQPVVEALQAGRLHSVIITSVRGLDNLWFMLGDSGRVLVQRRALVTVSPRIARYAEQAGHTGSVVVARSPADEDLLQAVHQASEHHNTR
ncbi:uroporphyrinogen-III synthase [Alkalilimnicola ehrlichii]|uniref:uroporphyrinogen-III synthase n=1 Tax=Alkalilimnicola ehrlichii TaxID=351052 RepID=UPI003BA15252